MAKRDYTVREAAAEAGVTASWVGQLVTAGRIKATKVPAPLARGFYYRIASAEVRRLKEEVPDVGRTRTGMLR